MSDIYHRRAGFTTPEPADEFLHALEPGVTDPSWTETSYLGFNIPEAGINCEIYHWFHPALRMMSGGIMIWRGELRYAPQADYFDYRNYLHYPEGDIDDIAYPTGVRVRVIEPLQNLQVSFTAPDGSVRLDMNCRAIMPPARRADGTHFAQAMKCTGELELRGERHTIDSWFTRDRSWSCPRPEDPHPIPPLTWGAAVFGDDLAFHFVGPDAETLDEAAMRWGYAWNGGELRELVRMRKRIARASDGLVPTAIEVELEDEKGETYRMSGTSQGLLPIQVWPNMLTQFSLMRYDLDGRIGYGDIQDIHFAHTLRRA